VDDRLVHKMVCSQYWPGGTRFVGWEDAENTFVGQEGKEKNVSCAQNKGPRGERGWGAVDELIIREEVQIWTHRWKAADGPR